MTSVVDDGATTAGAAGEVRRSETDAPAFFGDGEAEQMNPDLEEDEVSAAQLR